MHARAAAPPQAVGVGVGAGFGVKATQSASHRRLLQVEEGSSGDFASF
jgi:hypothetical protein